MLIRKFSLFIIHFSLLIVFAACTQTVEPPAPVSLRVASVSAGMTRATRAAQSASDTRANLTITVDEMSSVQALVALTDGTADAAIVSALLSGAEKFTQQPITRDGIAIITHPENPVDGVTLLELQKLFAGESYRWDDIPRGAGEVVVAVRERESGTRAVFDERVMEGRRITPMARVFPNAAAVREFVAQTPGAVGYISAALVDDSVKVLAVEDVSPVPKNLTNGAYPLAYELFLLTPPEPAPELRAFISVVAGERVSR